MKLKDPSGETRQDTGKKRRRYETTHSVHHQEPDYTRPLFQYPEDVSNRILKRLEALYGDEIAQTTMKELLRISQAYYAHKPLEMIEREKAFDPVERFTEEDVILITYGDLIRGQDRSPLATLSKFCGRHLKKTVNTLHILPFFPYSSDRGFAIVDFETVDPHLGTWQDIEDIESRYQLMFDGVINHVSSKNRWFQEFRDGRPGYLDFFIHYDSPDALTPEQRSVIFRPRTSDVLTPFNTINGLRYVWTTFSADQIDLNYKNPNVLLSVIEILLLYVRKGADIIRLDAITYLWAEPGTPCALLDQTHQIVKLFRDVLDCVAPAVSLITETNVPHEDNISYFGNGDDEAQMVYNFALPPLVLHTFYSEDATALSDWASELDKISDTTTFFNFLDSHDGVGLMAVKNILSKAQIDFLVQSAKDHGAFVSYKTIDNGKAEPYELNVTWFSALNYDDIEEDLMLQVKRLAASRAISFVLQGVPAIYLHGLFGSQNDVAGVLETDSNRAINRRVLDMEAIETAYQDPLSKISLIRRELERLGSIRTSKRAFHPNGPQKVLKISPRVFTLFRSSPEQDEHVLCLINISSEMTGVEIRLSDLGMENRLDWFDLTHEISWKAKNGVLWVTLLPYDIYLFEPRRKVEA